MTELQKLQDTYEKISEEKDAKVKAIKDGGLGLMKSCLVAKSSKGSDEL